MGNDRERFSKKVKFEETNEDTYFGDKEEELIRGIEARVLAGRRQAGKTDSELSEAPRSTCSVESQRLLGVSREGHDG